MKGKGLFYMRRGEMCWLGDIGSVIFGTLPRYLTEQPTTTVKTRRMALKLQRLCYPFAALAVDSSGNC
jgi:hypothetical protein